MSVARPQEMACRELVELLTDFLEGALDELAVLRRERRATAEWPRRLLERTSG